MNRWIVIALFTAISFVASAQPGHWTPYQTIQSIIIENGIALIVVKGGVPTEYIPTACNQAFNQANLSTEHGKAIYSLALAARMSDTPISMALECSGTRPSIKLIRL
ncbi:hypothetical protein [Shewanella woodyi]|uniref:Uncharacterized protein n=1 Tax=Shewanella woodyi (strain ATCC 51908 / MS32) TaxID=392500 RepID=B1KKC2_SHEWM|nr:hypothetical protein [Shewanella woodyi]ACA85762.1 hypothetical protein Swoo_1474 [Shewanella woodyi ATCC 51908]